MAEKQKGDMTPDIILVNGRIFTSVIDRPFVEAVAITGTRISATGYSGFIRSFAGHTTKVIDLQRRLATPGFNDAHTHFSPDAVGKTLRLGGMEPASADVSTRLKKRTSPVARL